MSFRALSQKYNISIGNAYSKCFKALEDLPHCADITRKYCSKYSGILLVDGKYITVKGYERKLPFIYGIDYLTHDIPTYIFSIAENFVSLKKFFASLRLLNYPLEYLVSDDNINILNSCLDIYPKVRFQLCINHFKENIRKSLNIRTDPTYKPFMCKIEDLLCVKRSEDDFNSVAKNILNQYKYDSNCIPILLDIERRKLNLMGYSRIPRTTNLIESFNSHFQAKFKALKGFESFQHADLWINGYIIKRRTRVFTDCKGKFKHLNGRNSLSISANSNVDLSMLF